MIMTVNDKIIVLHPTTLDQRRPPTCYTITRAKQNDSPEPPDCDDVTVRRDLKAGPDPGGCWEADGRGQGCDILGGREEGLHGGRGERGHAHIKPRSHRRIWLV